MEKWEKIRRHIYVSGRVQGVGFRFRTQHFAVGLGLTGWVKNLDDGRVEMEVQGTEEGIRQLLGYLRQERPIVIEDICSVDIPVKEEKAFRVTY
ncbi:acylphosphatase [Lacrimispora sp.]|uniref:acylphosphatase n=1 Tax=Lacrimispora sp. TaxID=2719234 RepID=UPI002FD9AE41